MEETKTPLAKMSMIEVEQKINESKERAIKKIEYILSQDISNCNKLAFIKARVLAAENQSNNIMNFTSVFGD